MKRTLVGNTSLSVVALILAMAGSTPRVWAEDAPAQPAAPPAEVKSSPIEVTGFVDAYYAYKLNKRADLYRNFDGVHNSISLNLTEIALEKKPTSDSRLGFRTDLDYGPAADAFSSADPYKGSGLTLEQAYLSYLPGKVQIDVGKFVTQHGAEVIETKDNWNYSRSLLFALAIPYYHLGVRAIYSPSDKLQLGGYLVNGWNNAVDNNTGKTFGAMLTIKPDASVSLVQNFMAGPEQTGTNSDTRYLADTVLTVTANSKLSLMANFDYGKQGSTKWLGVAGYARYQATPELALIPRFEWLDDSDAFMTGTSQKLKELTFTVEDKIAGGLLARLEFRRDFSDASVFTDADGLSVKGQSGVTLGLVYAFGAKLAQ
jgi:hypothetical protein